MNDELFSKITWYLFRKIKNDSTVTLKAVYKNSEYFFIIKYRLSQIFRGFVRRIFFKDIKGICFIGRNVKIQYGFLIKTGKSLILRR